MKNKNNRLARFFASLLLMLCFVSGLSFADQKVKVIVNGAPLNTDVSATIVDSRTLVPFRAIFETLGVKVDWDPTTETVMASNDKVSMTLKIGVKTIRVNDKAYEMDVAPMIISSRTMVPLRFVSEYMGAKVDWDPGTYTATVTSGDIASGIGDIFDTPTNPVVPPSSSSPADQFINIQGTFAMQDVGRNQYVVNFKPDLSLEIKDIIRGDKSTGTYSLDGFSFVMKSPKISSNFIKEDYKYNGRDIALMRDTGKGDKTFAITPISIEEFNSVYAN